MINILRITLQLRVDLTVDQTQKVFDRILTKLGHIAPPVLGFRMQKGGKMLHFLYHALSYLRFVWRFLFLASENE